MRTASVRGTDRCASPVRKRSEMPSSKDTSSPSLPYDEALTPTVPLVDDAVRMRPVERRVRVEAQRSSSGLRSYMYG